MTVFRVDITGTDSGGERLHTSSILELSPWELPSTKTSGFEPPTKILDLHLHLKTIS